MIDPRVPQSDDSRLCIGLMSGTSVDAVDAALVRINGVGAGAAVELVAFSEMPFPTALRREVFLLFEQAEGSVARLCALNVLLGDFFAEAALAVCRQAGVSPSEVFVVGSHGQTVWHQPEADAALPPHLSAASTLQIGSPAVIAARTGIQVVADFRAADMAAGGQGAPLVPYFDWVTLRHPTRNRAAQNIGGIANVTWLPAGASLDAVRAFDTGPGNMVIDGLTTLLTAGRQTFDEGGRLAAAGRTQGRLLDRWLADPYFEREPPKTTGRERYGLQFCRRLLAEAGLSEGVLAREDSTPEAKQAALDLIATATALTARSIADAYRRWLPGVDEVIVSGGGARNPALVQMLTDLLAPVSVTTAEAQGIDGAAKEAMAFALLAHDALHGLPTNVPGATGARYAVTLGSLTPPRG